MKRQGNGISSDLELARSISRRLRPMAASQPAVREVEDGYIQFSLERMRARESKVAASHAAEQTLTPGPDHTSAPRSAAADATPLARPSLAPVTGAAMDSRGWERVLASCRSLVHASSAFVVDERGLVIASEGALSGEQAQGVGARVVIALEQADQIANRPSDSIAIELGSAWVTGLRLVMGSESLMIGFVGPQPVSTSVRKRIVSAFERSLRVSSQAEPRAVDDVS